MKIFETVVESCSRENIVKSEKITSNPTSAHSERSEKKTSLQISNFVLFMRNRIVFLFPIIIHATTPARRKNVPFKHDKIPSMPPPLQNLHDCSVTEAAPAERPPHPTEDHNYPKRRSSGTENSNCSLLLTRLAKRAPHPGTI